MFNKINQLSKKKINIVKSEQKCVSKNNKKMRIKTFKRFQTIKNKNTKNSNKLHKKNYNIMKI